MSRLRILFLLCAVLALAAVLAACGSSSSSSDKNPQTVVNDATLQGIKSGNLDLSLDVNAEGDKGGKVDVSLSGPFQSQGNKQLPQLDMTAKVSGSLNSKDIDFEGGLTLLSDRAYVNYKGTVYEVDPTTFSFVKSTIQQSQQQSGGQSSSGVSSACTNALSAFKVGDFVSNLTNDGSSDVGGTSTTHVSGDLDTAGALDALVKIAGDPACRSQLGSGAGQLPSGSQLDQAKSEVASAVKSAHVDLYVGDDNIIRRIAVDLSIEPPAGSGGGPKSVDLSMDLSLTGVNESQTISAPSGAKPLNDLFQQLGINPLSLLGNSGGFNLNGLSGGGGGAGGIGSLLQGITGAAGGSSSSGSGGGSGSLPDSTQAYLDCVQKANTPVDLQKCAQLNK